MPWHSVSTEHGYSSRDSYAQSLGAQAAKPLGMAELPLLLWMDVVPNESKGSADLQLEAALSLVEQHIGSYSPPSECAKEKVKVIQSDAANRIYSEQLIMPQGCACGRRHLQNKRADTDLGASCKASGFLSC